MSHLERRVALLAFAVIVLSPIGAAVGCTGTQHSIEPVPTGEALRAPRLNRDSTRLAFALFGTLPNSGTPPGVYVTEIGLGAAKLVRAYAYSPTWSPDGGSLAYSEPRLATTDLASGLTTLLTTFHVDMPQWSPDDSAIAFAAFQDSSTGGRVIWLVHPDGSNLRDISVHGTGEWLYPAWSPHGALIVHSRYSALSPGAQIFVMRSDGTNAQRLTFSTVSDIEPAWAPDSTQIAFVRQSPGGSFIWIMDADGSRAQSLVAGVDPSWLPSGQGLIFALTSSRAATSFGMINRDGTGLRYVTPTLSRQQE